MKFLLVFCLLISLSYACDENFTSQKIFIKRYFKKVHPHLVQKVSLTTKLDFKKLFEATDLDFPAVLKTAQMALARFDERTQRQIYRVIENNNKENLLRELKSIYTKKLVQSNYRTQLPFDKSQLKEGDIIALSTRRGATAFMSNMISSSPLDHLAVVGKDKGEWVVYNFNLRYKVHRISLDEFIQKNSDNGFVYSLYRPKNTLNIQKQWQKVVTGEKIESCTQLTTFLAGSEGAVYYDNYELSDKYFAGMLTDIWQKIIFVENEKYLPSQVVENLNLIRTNLKQQSFTHEQMLGFWYYHADSRRIAKKFFLEYLDLKVLPKNFDDAFKGYLLIEYRINLMKELFESMITR